MKIVLMAKISLIVNGIAVNAKRPPHLLCSFARNLRLDRTHVGCDTSHGGACVVPYSTGKAVKSCTTPRVYG